MNGTGQTSSSGIFKLLFYRIRRKRLEFILKMAKQEIQGIWISEITIAVKDLSWADKALLEKMNQLDNSEKGCFASNQYLADFLGIKKQSAANAVTSLVKRKFLHRIWSDGKNRGYRSVLHHPEAYSKKYASDEKPYSNEEGSATEAYSKINEAYSNEEGNHTQISNDAYSNDDSEPYSNEEHNYRDKDEYLKEDIDHKKIEINGDSGLNKWKEILKILEKKLAPDVLQSWFKTITFVGIDEEKKLIRILSSQFNKDWVNKNYEDEFCEALNKSGLSEFAFDWKIRSEAFEVGK